MTSIAHQKHENREWISDYFENHIAKLELDELRNLTMWCIWKLAASMTLTRLKQWRHNLEREKSRTS